jgi:hypothetical protein
MEHKMTRIDEYRAILPTLTDWDAYLMAESGLPGPRGNLELAQAAAELAAEADLARWRRLTLKQAPVNSPYEFLVFCGALGLRRGVLEGDAPGREAALGALRPFAADPRWRTREAVAMALQSWGAAHAADMLNELEAWARGNAFEQRAAVAAIAEPAVLLNFGAKNNPTSASDPLQKQVFDVLDRITASFAAVPPPEQRSEGYQALKKGLAYGWSVAVAYLPQAGKPRLERWFVSTDRDVLWVMRENLKKARLERMDAAWTAGWKEKLGVNS